MGDNSTFSRLLLSALTVASCSVGGGIDLPQGSASAVSRAAGSASASAQADAGAPPTSAATVTDWREATRLFKFDRARELIAALDEKERAKARVRLAEGWLALQAKEHEVAVTALDGLAAKLPLAKEEIAQWYAEAAAHAGPFDAAGATLGGSPLVRDNILGAQAYHRGGDLGKARVTIDTAIKRAQRNRRKTGEAEAHLVRAEIAEAQKQRAVAAADYRWVVEHAPGHARVREAIAGVDRNGGIMPLDMRLTAIAKSTSPLNLEKTMVILGGLRAKHPTENDAHTLAKARAIYHARDYAPARDAFDAFVALKSPGANAYRAEALYYAARAAERASDIDGALKRYHDVTARYASTGWAERGSYRHAELLLTSGRYPEAAKGFASYMSRFGKSKSRDAAHYGRAMALLDSGKPKKAAELFKTLREKSKERRFVASLRHLEGVAWFRAGKKKRAKKLWFELIREQPLTWGALAAHARLHAAGHTPMPPLIGGTESSHHTSLPITLPSAPKLFHEIGLDMIAERRLADMEQEAARVYPSRESEALCEMYGQLSVARQRSRVGNRAVSLDVLMRAPGANERWAWHCVYPKPYTALVLENEARFGIPAGMVHAIMRQESAFKTNALSPVGAQGLMQLMPNTASRAAGEIPIEIEMDHVWRPDINLQLGSFYIGKLLKNFGTSVPIAAAAYNAGPHAVQRWLQPSSSAQGDELDVWVSRIPYRETRLYVQRVMTNFARYQYLAGGRAAVVPLDLKVPSDTKIDDDAY